MFHYLKGTVAEIDRNLAVIDCGGVGYACNTTATTISYLSTGKEAKLYTYCYIREDAFDIYGFYSRLELHCFEMLIGVSGVGPKAALSMLSSSTPEALTLAIVSEDARALTVAPGIGKKIAQRIILELKDKMAGESAALAGGGGALPMSGGNGVNEAAAALAVLGYTPSEINAALRGMDTQGMSTEEIIRETLKRSLK